MSAARRGEGVTVVGVGRAVLLDRADKPGSWWAMPSGGRRALCVVRKKRAASQLNGTWEVLYR